MSYLALYRKYRPRIFEDVVGQEHIVRTLQNQIKVERVAHAYLFTGSRGTGKTTIAKIFARAINCSEPVNGSACGVCETCKKIEDGASINIIEMDAASHNGVDNIREINEEVKYSPAVGRYKVYIIDEVHMLSTGAFNALLKTLEEPPSHVVFILATTDPQKIPVTILSRCQRFDFKRIPASQIQARLFDYMQIESVAIEESALAYIARLADGGMRDALSLLEQCISFYFEEDITTAKVQYLVGAVDAQILFDMIEALSHFDSPKAMSICDEVNSQGRSIRQFTTDLLVHCRNLLVAKTTQGEAGVLDYSKEYIDKLFVQAEGIDIGVLMYYIKHFGALDQELKIATNQKILLEVALLKLSEVVIDESTAMIEQKIEALQHQIERLEVTGVKVTQSEVLVTPSPTLTQPVIKPTKLPEAVPDDIRTLVTKWEGLKGRMNAGSRMAYGSTSAGVIEGDIFYIVHGKNMEAVLSRHLEDVKRLLNNELQKEVKVQLIDALQYAGLSKRVHGSHPEQNDVTVLINDTLQDIQSKLNYDIHTVD